MSRCRLPTLACLSIAASFTLAVAAWAQTPPAGELKGTAIEHTPQSALGVVDNAQVVLPAAATGGALYAGPWRDAPRQARRRVPVVVFLHGSSGLGLAAIGDWQRWLATLGIGSVAPDSFALPDRVTYRSPVGKDVYEKLHAMRLSEISLTLRALAAAPWADSQRLVLAGTSEGAVAVARYRGTDFVGRLVYSWSCENNYFVKEHDSWLPASQPVLNIVSATDVYFSPSNPWLGNPAARGHCGEVLKDHKQSAVVLIPGAPHTLLNLPMARHATAGFLRDLLRPEPGL